MTPDAEALNRLMRIERAIVDQRAFLHRVPDPDTRYRAEDHLLRLVEMHEQVARELKPERKRFS